MNQHGCPFCRLEKNRVRLEREFAVAFLDGFSLTPGHTLVLPKWHVASLFELSDEGQPALWALVGEARAPLLAELRPDGFTVGLNDGPAAGQTGPHAHVIPRCRGDVADARGGVQWAVPAKAACWAGGWS